MVGGEKTVLFLGDPGASEEGLGAVLRQACDDYWPLEFYSNLNAVMARLEHDAIRVAVLARGDDLERSRAGLVSMLAIQPGLAVVVMVPSWDEATEKTLLRDGAKEIIAVDKCEATALRSRIQRAMARADAAWTLLSGMAQESEIRYRALFSQASDTILILEQSAEGIAEIVDANDAACRLLGYTHDELVGAPVERFVTDRFKENLRDVLREVPKRLVDPVEIEHRCQDGEVFSAEVTMRSVEFGGRLAVQAVYKDITERRRAESERARFEDQLRQSQKMEAVGTLAGGLAHDMNNVLGAIMAVASVVRAEGDAISEESQDIEEILGACHRGRELTKNLLSFARKEPPQMKRFALNDVVREVESLLKHTFPKQVEVVLDVQKKLPLIKGDPGQINHALINVCINGAHAMKGVGRLIMRTEAASIDLGDPLTRLGLRPGPYVVMTISDTGSGMDVHTLEHAFEPFFTTKPPGEGTGLGLAMVYSTVKTHGGLVTLHSEGGSGSTVTIHLPAEVGEEGRATHDSDVPFPVAAKTGKVLLIDDERMVRSAGKRVLKSLGYEVLTAANGEIGVRLYREHGPDLELVILDLLMPVKNGEETFNELLRIDPDARILITSGYAHALEVSKLLKAGALGFLEKPFDRRALNSAIVRALQKKRR